MSKFNLTDRNLLICVTLAYAGFALSLVFATIVALVAT